MPALGNEDWVNIIKKFKNFGIKRILLTGGEPLLIKNIEYIFRLSKEKGIITSLNTNGTLLNRKKILDFSEILDEIILSIDGSTPLMHAMMRNCNLSVFNHLFECIQEIKENHKIRCRVNSVACKKNILNLSGLGELLIRHKVDEWRIIQFYPMNEAKNISDLLSIDENTFHSFTEEIAKRYRQENMHISFGSNREMSGSLLSMAPNGSIFTSDFGIIYWLGHIFDSNIVNLLKHDRFKIDRHIEKYKIMDKWYVK